MLPLSPIWGFGKARSMVVHNNLNARTWGECAWTLNTNNSLPFDRKVT